MTITYEFTGRMTNDGCQAAQMVCAIATEGDVATDTDGEVPTKYIAVGHDLARRVADELGDDWDERAVLALLGNCMFSVLS